MELKDHNPSGAAAGRQVAYETRPLGDPSGRSVEGLHQVWLTLDNPRQLNAFTVEMLQDLLAGLQRANHDRACVAVVLTGAGDRAFSTGGHAGEYAEYYAGRPDEYRQYLRLFNDVISGLLQCDKPVICRVNGMRVGGGQELGLACDFSLAQDLAVFGQAGPRHGSAPIAGSTDFLPLLVGAEAAMESCTLCQPWSAHKAQRLGMLTRIVPALKLDGDFVPNPRVITDRWLDGYGRIVHGEFKQGREREAADEACHRGQVDLRLLDEAVDELVLALASTFPGCLARTIEGVRRHKRERWDAQREASRAWLALNMATEGRAGFRAYCKGAKGDREIDFFALRRQLAQGRGWDDRLLEELLAPLRQRAARADRDVG